MPKEMKLLAVLIIGAFCLVVSCYGFAQVPEHMRAPGYEQRWGDYDRQMAAWKQKRQREHAQNMADYDRILGRLGFPVSQKSPVWGWSPAKPHHAAVMQIRQGSAAGTCFLTSANTVVTAHHVVESGNQARVTIQGGRQVPATVIARDRHEDIAILQLAQATLIPPLKLGQDAKPGELIELCGFGGPSGRLRHWFATASNATESNTVVLNGDSGGCVLRVTSGEPEVVGVISGGYNTKAFRAGDGSQWRLVYPTCFGRGLPIRNFFRGLVGAPFVRVAPANSGYS